MEVPPSLPSTSGFNETPATTVGTDDTRGKEIETREQDVHRMCSDLNASQDFVGGIMKIVPSVVDVSLIFQKRNWGEGRRVGLIHHYL